MSGLVHEGDAALGEVDHGGDHQRSGENCRDGEHRAGPGRAGDDHEKSHAVRNRERTEVPGRVRGRCPLVAEKSRDGHDDDLDRDDGEKGAHHRRRRGAVGYDGGANHSRRQIGRRRWRRGAPSGPGCCRRGEVPAFPTAPEMGVDQPLVDAELLAVGACRDGLTPSLARHGGQVARRSPAVPGILCGWARTIHYGATQPPPPKVTMSLSPS
jgi:hypothetical protein